MNEFDIMTVVDNKVVSIKFQGNLDTIRDEWLRDKSKSQHFWTEWSQ